MGEPWPTAALGWQRQPQRQPQLWYEGQPQLWYARFARQRQPQRYLHLSYWLPLVSLPSRSLHRRSRPRPPVSRAAPASPRAQLQRPVWDLPTPLGRAVLQQQGPGRMEKKSSASGLVCSHFCSCSRSGRFSACGCGLFGCGCGCGCGGLSFVGCDRGRGRPSSAGADRGCRCDSSASASSGFCFCCGTSTCGSGSWPQLFPFPPQRSPTSSYYYTCRDGLCNTGEACARVATGARFPGQRVIQMTMKMMIIIYMIIVHH